MVARTGAVVLALAMLFAFAATARADYGAGASAFQAGDYAGQTAQAPQG